MPDPTDAIENAIIAAATASKEASNDGLAPAAADFALAAERLAEARAWFKAPSSSHSNNN